MNPPEAAGAPEKEPEKNDRAAPENKAASSCCLGCLFHPAVLIFAGALLFICSVVFKVNGSNSFDDWMERNVKAIHSSISSECDYEGCSNESSWKVDFITWGDMVLPDNPNYPGASSHTYQSTEKSVRREENTYLVPDGDKIKVETKKEWKEYDTPVKKGYDTFYATYCDEHKDAAEKLIWDTVYWEHYKYIFIGIGVGAVLFAVGLVRLLIMRAKKKKQA